MRPFLFVFENLPRLRIHSNLVHGTAALDVEGIAETAAALLPFQFFVVDRSRPRLQSDGAGLIEANFCPFCKFLPGVRDQVIRQRGYQPDKGQAEAMASNLLIEVLLYVQGSKRWSTLLS
jgi:hypothetical protein